jgi:hypothetical protein
VLTSWEQEHRQTRLRGISLAALFQFPADNIPGVQVTYVGLRTIAQLKLE